MELPIYQIDAFTDQLFTGNPAAVVVLTEWLAPDVMLAIAQENNLAETAFVLPRGPEFHIRWFTPEVEVDLCGHATLASAHVLFSEKRTSNAHIIFRYKGGTIVVQQAGDQLAMEFPSRPAEPIRREPALVAALGTAPLEVYRARDLMAVLSSEAEVRALRPDIAGLARLDAFGFIVTAPGDECDFVSRFFAPRAGIPEDPVTGSAHCTLVPYWSERLGKTELHARQVSQRGGELFCEDLGDRIKLAGRCVEYLRGVIRV
ncbi:MAG: PhzF family phenazine biosynthesis protein [Acidobacteriota bacterium]|nr:PhzF family phenazine biosynthesis protein [Acidobacteriota bacterium]